jgi:hypothetical protein
MSGATLFPLQGTNLLPDNIKPTLAGPYDVVDQPAQPNAAPTKQPRVVAPRKLVKKDADGKVVGEVSATELGHDVESIAQIDIGTPAQTMEVVFDSGSADL